MFLDTQRAEILKSKTGLQGQRFENCIRGCDHVKTCGQRDNRDRRARERERLRDSDRGSRDVQGP